MNKGCVFLLSLTIITIQSSFSSAAEGNKTGGKHHEWDYGSPTDWGKSHKTCDGLRQSPIVITPNLAVLRPYPKFKFTNYDQIYPMIINNNGHSVLVSLPPDLPLNSVPKISGGGLTDDYLFLQLHFHWGNTTIGGSEHVIGPYRYPAEMHLVHFKASYKNLTEAIKYEDGLAVLGVFMEREAGQSHVAFRHFVNLFDQIKTEGPKVSLPTPIYLMDLLPDDVDNFYRYAGSLTTPGCQESVVWTVFDSPIFISTPQYGKFLTLFGGEGKYMTNNFRPPTNLYDRVVTYRSESLQPLRQQPGGTTNIILQPITAISFTQPTTIRATPIRATTTPPAAFNPAPVQPPPAPSSSLLRDYSPTTEPPDPPSEWSYSAPADWGNFYSECDGLHQSPIVISPSSAVYKSYPQFNFSQHYNTTIPMKVTNNGHSILLHFPSDFPLNQLPNVNGGGLPDNYIFSQLHFHWGSNPSAGGSEHAINLKRYPAEMHMVHFNSKYKTLSEAVNHADGLAVFAIFIDTNTTNYSLSTNPKSWRWGTAFQSLTSVFNQFQMDNDSEVKLPIYFPLWYLLPDDLGNFYRYKGSLTTPGCSEIVTWTVFDSPITIAPFLFQQFQNLENDEGDPLKDNYRPAMPLSNRIVTFRSDNGKRLRPNFSSEKILSSVSSFSHSAIITNKNIPKVTNSNGNLNSYSIRTNSNVQTIKNFPPLFKSGASAPDVGTGSNLAKILPPPQQFPAG